MPWRWRRWLFRVWIPPLKITAKIVLIFIGIGLGGPVALMALGTTALWAISGLRSSN
jgi:hypothetical protein